MTAARSAPRCDPANNHDFGRSPDRPPQTRRERARSYSRSPESIGFELMIISVPTSAPVPTKSAEQEYHDHDDQQCVRIHCRTLRKFRGASRDRFCSPITRQAHRACKIALLESENTLAFARSHLAAAQPSPARSRPQEGARDQTCACRTRSTGSIWSHGLVGLVLRRRGGGTKAPPFRISLDDTAAEGEGQKIRIPFRSMPAIRIAGESDGGRGDEAESRPLRSATPSVCGIGSPTRRPIASTTAPLI
jgi:hypothetical protein